MQRACVGLGLLALFLMTGCNNGTRLGGILRSGQPPRPTNTELPTTTQLVEFLNANARQIQTLEVQELDLDCKAKLQPPAGLRGRMVCQKQRNFRLGAKLLGNQVVDMGSNENEFWFWISKAEPPYLFHCSYADYARGDVRMPFPFQPEWIMEAMGMAEYGAPENYQLVERGETLHLIQETRSPQGQPVKKITVFNRNQSAVQVPHLMLQDAQGKELCSAHIIEVQRLNGTGPVIPRRVTLSWPSEGIELKLKLDDVALNRQLGPDRTAQLFTRPRLANVPSYDLARGLDPAPQGIRPAGGLPR